jgi:hypothetical protein
MTTLNVEVIRFLDITYLILIKSPQREFHDKIFYAKKSTTKVSSFCHSSEV